MVFSKESYFHASPFTLFTCEQPDTTASNDMIEISKSYKEKLLQVHYLWFLTRKEKKVTIPNHGANYIFICIGPTVLLGAKSVMSKSELKPQIWS